MLCVTKCATINENAVNIKNKTENKKAVHNALFSTRESYPSANNRNVASLSCFHSALISPAKGLILQRRTSARKYHLKLANIVGRCERKFGEFRCIKEEEGGGGWQAWLAEIFVHRQVVGTKKSRKGRVIKRRCCYSIAR